VNERSVIDVIEHWWYLAVQPSCNCDWSEQ
jgi:hypothetical protein